MRYFMAFSTIAISLCGSGCSEILSSAERAAGNEIGREIGSAAGKKVAGNSENSGSSSATSTGSGASTSSVPSTGSSNVQVSGQVTNMFGSCLIKNADGTPMMCHEFHNVPVEAAGMIRHNVCVGGNQGWQDGTCSSVGRAGGCQSKPDSKGTYIVEYFYDPGLASAARDSCTKNNNGNSWVP